MRTRAFFLLLALGALSPHAGGQGVEVELLKHSYPFKASLTVISDTHKGAIEPLGQNVREFEAIHALLNETWRLTRDSPEWRLLGLEGLSSEQYPQGIRGFGFPFADTFWVYDRHFSLFVDWDPATGEFIRHELPGVDLERKFLEWYRRGYIQALHTFGMGEITTEKSRAALQYLERQLPHRVTIHVNHSKSRTPAGVGAPAATLLNQVLVDLRYRVCALLRIGGLSTPRHLPRGLKAEGYVVLSIGVTLLLASAVWAAFNLLRGRSGPVHVRNLAVCAVFGVAGFGAFAWLWATRVDFYRGDNPESRFYNLPLLQEYGVRFYNTVNSDYWQGTLSGLVQVEQPTPDGRSSVFRVYEFDDGSRELAFLRNTIEGGPKTLGLLTRKNLARLAEVGGWSILYCHWNSNPRRYFTPENVACLENLRRVRDAGVVNVTSANQMLACAYAYSYLQYEYSGDQQKITITLTGFNDPARGHRPVELADLSGLSFKCSPAREYCVLIAGRSVPRESLEQTRLPDATILTLR